MLCRGTRDVNVCVLQDAGEHVLHCAVREGLTAVVQTMCAFGCKVNCLTKVGALDFFFLALNHFNVMMKMHSSTKFQSPFSVHFFCLWD